MTTPGERPSTEILKLLDDYVYELYEDSIPEGAIHPDDPRWYRGTKTEDARAALLAALGALENKKQEWQPIETAPKKGSILAYADVSGFPNIFVSRWWKGDEQYDPRWEGGHQQPSHWMPLPTPPIDTALNAGGKA